MEACIVAKDNFVYFLDGCAEDHNEILKDAERYNLTTKLLICKNGEITLMGLFCTQNLCCRWAEKRLAQRVLPSLAALL